jgi:hypothetical protein
MATTIRIKRTITPGAVPVAGDLQQGELAVNLYDRKLFTKDQSNNVVELTSAGGAGISLWTANTATPPPSTNYLWFNTDTGRVLVSVNDGTSTQWVDASPSIQGEKGQKGEIGEKGQKGEIGETTIPWVVANSNFTANTNNKYLVDTSQSAIAVTLGTPSTNGVSLMLRDYASNWDINNVTINANNQVVNLIGESNTQVILDVADAEVSLIWNGTNWRLF